MEDEQRAPGFPGLYPAVVTNLVDEERLGRIEVKFPWLGAAGDDVRAWATLLSPYADDQQGLFALPAPESQVVVGFEAGDPRRPYIVGSAWNGREAMPEQPSAANDKRVFRSRAGSLLEFDDRPGAVEVTLRTAGGHLVVLDEGGGSVELRHASGHVITLDPGGQVTIRANATVEVHASALNVHAATATFDGSITCTSLTATVAVASPSYTLGAGNSW